MIDMKVKTWLNQKQVLAATRQASIPRIRKCALLVEAEAKQSMVKGGRTTGSRGGKVFLPAPKGKPPHVQTGNLRASIQSAPTRWLTYVVGPTLQAWYGRLLEFGRTTKTGVSKHPFMRPALQKTKRKFAAFFKGIPLAHTPAGQILNRSKGPL